MIQKVILVNEKDEVLGSMEKLEAHLKGALHRAFSIFIFNDQKELLIHQRAFDKYHSPGLWTNTCCSHPFPEETTLGAANRRLEEEMGMQCSLTPIFTFVYKAGFENGLTEHEFDHVMIGYYNSEPKININEVADWKWMSLENVRLDIKSHPENYTAWFKIIFDKFYQHINVTK